MEGRTGECTPYKYKKKTKKTIWCCGYKPNANGSISSTFHLLVLFCSHLAFAAFGLCFCCISPLLLHTLLFCYRSANCRLHLQYCLVLCIVVFTVPFNLFTANLCWYTKALAARILSSHGRVAPQNNVARSSKVHILRSIQRRQLGYCLIYFLASSAFCYKNTIRHLFTSEFGINSSHLKTW